MKNLFNKLVGSKKRSIRVNRSVFRASSSVQIAKMGRMGQQLIVASK